jgi:hypothetical protein
MLFSFLFSFLLSCSSASLTPEACSPRHSTEDIQITRTFEHIGGSNAYKVTVTLQVKGLSGFAKYTEFFPPGVQATVITDGGSSTSVGNDKMKFIWVSYPDTPEIKVSYTISFPDNKLIMHYRGEFGYISDNVVKTYKLEPKDLKLIGG